MASEKRSDKPKPGTKPRPKGAGWVIFEVSPAAYSHLRWLIPRSGLGETEDEVAQSLFRIELQESMKDPKRHTAHQVHWHVEATDPDGKEEEDPEKGGG